MYRARKILNAIIPIKYYFFDDVMHHFRNLCKYNASIDTDKDIDKMRYTLLRENHVIEKGLSMKKVRKGFGQDKVQNLLIRLNKYADLYVNDDRNFMLYPLCTIKNYIKYTLDCGINIPEIIIGYNNIVEKVGFSDSELILDAGVVVKTKEQIIDACNSNFGSLLLNRHSIRYYSEEIPSKEDIEKALILAQRTPSACNRQAWRTHVYKGEDCHRLLKMQGGCRGFENNIHCAIVVTCELKGFLSYEPFQCYIDGGLYSMTLINAIHSLGMGCIPLSCGFHHKKLDSIKKEFNIPQSEVLITILGFGMLEDEFKVAISTRKNIIDTNIFHYE